MSFTVVLFRVDGVVSDGETQVRGTTTVDGVMRRVVSVVCDTVLAGHVMARPSNGELLLLSNEIAPGNAANLSFEREFGKLIAYQDTLALVMAQRTNRTIRRVSQALATAVFLPL